MDLEKRIIDCIDSHINEYMEIVQSLYDHPEIGNQEYETVKTLTSYLKKAGFEVTFPYVCETGFLGEYKTKKPGPKIAFMLDYDALPEVGHGCGHNLIAGTGIAAGEALKSVLDEIGGTVWIVGTPAEENFGGKVVMAEAGIFDDVDAALMVHPGTSNGVGGKTNAINPVRFEFFGKNAHGCDPQEGRSALDCAVLTYININMLRQMVEPNTFIHGVISNGGEAANVIPAYACLDYYFRAPTMKYALSISDRAKKMAQAMADANECTLKTSIYEMPYDDNLVNYTLADLLTKKYQYLGLKEIDPVNEIPGGSSDIGAVSYRCPTIQGGIKIVPESVTWHSKDVANATISEAGKNGLLIAAKAIALMGLDLITKPEILAKVKEEFANATAK